MKAQLDLFNMLSPSQGGSISAALYINSDQVEKLLKIIIWWEVHVTTSQSPGCLYFHTSIPVNSILLINHFEAYIAQIEYPSVVMFYT